MRNVRVLFCLRERGSPYYNPHHSPQTKDWQNKEFTGLANSVSFVTEMLEAQGIPASWIRLADNNGIDAAVKAFQATHVIIEALWVVPSKLPVLIAANPGVKWNLRLHSELPFLAQEGIAIQWIYQYLQTNGEGRSPVVSVSANSTRMQADLKPIVDYPILYTPNYYPLGNLVPRRGLPADNLLDVGCFGAIRPLKDQLMQAVAAIQFADQIDRAMRFHINGDRIEMKGDPILHNLVALFANNPRHQLVQHGWLNRTDFLALCQTMDLGMQVSFSETFNIVSADLTSVDCPIVVSPEVVWAAPSIQADPTSISDIVDKLSVAWAGRATNLHHKNYAGLQAYNLKSEKAWPTALLEM